MLGMQLFASATAFRRSHTLPPSEMKSLYGSITRRAVISFSYVTFAMVQPPFRSTITQLAHQPGQVHFRVSGLESALDRGLDALLGLGVAHALAEEIGIATEVLGRRECDRIDPVLDRDQASGRKPGDPMSERSD